MAGSRHRHNLTDRVGAVLEPLLPGREGVWPGVAQVNRHFINAVMGILRNGSPWRDLPTDYGDWKSTHRRSRRSSLTRAMMATPVCSWRRRLEWRWSSRRNPIVKISVHTMIFSTRGGIWWRTPFCVSSTGGGRGDCHWLCQAHFLPHRRRSTPVRLLRGSSPLNDSLQDTNGFNTGPM